MRILLIYQVKDSRLEQRGLKARGGGGGGVICFCFSMLHRNNGDAVNESWLI